MKTSFLLFDKCNDIKENMALEKWRKKMKKKQKKPLLLHINCKKYFTPEEGKSQEKWKWVICQPDRKKVVSKVKWFVFRSFFDR